MTRCLPHSLRAFQTIILMALIGACSQLEPTNTSQDIFIQDTDGQRRHKAEGDQLLWTIDMSGCTGHLISPDHMMTAAHCQPRRGASYRSGSSIKNGGGRDITVEQVVELNGPPYDYAILKIRWNGQRPEDQKFPPLIATQASDLQVGIGDSQGDEIYTVGFPADKFRSWGATYAEGRAKRPFLTNLQYNIGIINGNSGGGVWRKSDNMLVSLTNGGPSMLNRPGWQGNDKNDSNHWNHGVAMWNVYPRSRTLQDIFPGGRNRFARQDENNGRLDLVNKLFLAIGDEDNSAADAFAMTIAAPETVASIAMCQGQAACETGSAGFTTTAQDGSRGDRKLHKTNAPIALLPGATWAVTAFDASGKSIGVQTIRFDQKP